MMVPMNDLGRAQATHARELRAAIERVVSSGWYVQGAEHAAFEAELASAVGTAHGIGVACGTDALELCVRAVAADRPGPVVTAANAGGYTSTAARRAGRQLCYADVDPRTLCLSDATLAPVLGGPVAAVVVTHLYGHLGDVEPIAALCRQHGIPLIEDCAQAIGAKRNGRAAGSFGDVAAFSFYPTKNLGALGDGGAVVTDDAVIAERVRALRQYGWSRKYVIDVPGGANSRLDEIQAAVLRVRLPHVDAGNARRRELIGRYVEASTGSALRVLPIAGEDHAGHLAVGLAQSRNAVRRALEAAGVRTEVHYPVADHRQPAFANLHADVSLPVTEAAAAQVLSLPCFPELTEHEADHVCRALDSL